MSGMWATPVIRLNYSGIRLGRSGNRPKLTVPWRLVKDVNAATPDVPALQSLIPQPKLDIQIFVVPTWVIICILIFTSFVQKPLNLILPERKLAFYS